MQGTVRLRLDLEGVLTSRTVLDYGPSRWFVLSRSEVVLQEEVNAPAGQRRSEARLRSPLEQSDFALGVEAGPLILGPIEGRGLYHRLRDPTRGGAAWDALTDRTRFVPVTDPERLDRSGVALTIGSERGPAKLAGWYLQRDGSYTIEGIDGTFSPLPDQRLGTIGVLLAGITPDADQSSLPEDEPWYYELPPEPSGVRRIQAVHWRFDRDDSLFRPDVLLEGWRQRSGYGPPLFAGTSYAALGPPVLRGSLRFSRSAPGFKTAEGGRTRYADQLAAELSHGRSYTPARLESHLRWTRSRGWEDERPGPVRVEREVSIATTRWRVSWFPVLDRIRFSGRHRSDGTPDSRDYYRGESSVAFLFDGYPRGHGSLRVAVTASADSEERVRTAASVLRLWSSRAMRARGRTGSWEISGRVQWDRGTVGDWYTSVNLDVPLGQRVRLSARIRREDDWQSGGSAEWSGSLMLEYGW